MGPGWPVEPCIPQFLGIQLCSESVYAYGRAPSPNGRSSLQCLGAKDGISMESLPVEQRGIFTDAVRIAGKASRPQSHPDRNLLVNVRNLYVHPNVPAMSPGSRLLSKFLGAKNGISPQSLLVEQRGIPMPSGWPANHPNRNPW